MIQRQLGLVYSIVRKDDMGEFIQSLVDSLENDDSTIPQDMVFRLHNQNLNLRVREYQESIYITPIKLLNIWIVRNLRIRQ